MRGFCNIGMIGYNYKKQRKRGRDYEYIKN